MLTSWDQAGYENISKRLHLSILNNHYDRSIKLVDNSFQHSLALPLRSDQRLNYSPDNTTITAHESRINLVQGHDRM